MVQQVLTFAQGSRATRVTGYVPYLLTDAPDGKMVFTLFKDEYNVFVKQFFADFIRSTLKDVKKTITNEQIDSPIDEANEKGIAKITI